MKQSPIFTRVHDLLLWLLKATRNFPRDQRFVMARRVQEQAFAVQDALIAFNRDRANEAAHLIQADIALTSLRKSGLLSYQMGLLKPGQYRHVYSGPHCQDRKRVKIKSHYSFLLGKLVFGWLTDIDELEENRTQFRSSREMDSNHEPK